MSSCEGRDVYLLKVATTAPSGSTSANATAPEPDCLSAAAGLPECPDGWCRCSGQWRRRVERPWGAPQKPCGLSSDPGPVDPARGRRAAMREAVIPKLQDLLTALAPHSAALAADDEERVEDLRQWHARLQVEK